jgi:hypothetical protein
MVLEVARAERPLPSLTTRLFGGAGPDTFHDAYVVSEAGSPRWQALVHWGEATYVPFHEACVWPSADVVVIGGGTRVYFARLADGEPRGHVEVADGFGHLALDAGEPGVRDEALYVLGWEDAYAVGPDLKARWRAPKLAVDGLVFYEAIGTVVRLSAEMDPPGGWFDVEVDAATGRELGRRPAFLDHYVGLYGSGRP